MQFLLKSRDSVSACKFSQLEETKTKNIVGGGGKRGKLRNRMLAMENKLMIARGEVGQGMSGMGEIGDGD